MRELTDDEISEGLLYSHSAIKNSRYNSICIGLFNYSNTILGFNETVMIKLQPTVSIALQKMFKIEKPRYCSSGFWWHPNDKQSRIDFLTKEIEKYK